jgi:outer membrane protein assembly factor BamD (BamD/ComL family)
MVLLRVGTAAAQASAGSHYATSDSGSERRSDAYREGQRALENEEWDDASRIFGKLASRSSDETDAALYWKAYADWKQKLKKESLEGLRQLLSAWAVHDLNHLRQAQEAMAFRYADEVGPWRVNLGVLNRPPA